MLDWLDRPIAAVDDASIWADVQPAANLPGWVWKELVVPAGHMAVVEMPGVSLQVFPPGSHRLGRLIDWYTGRLSRTQIGVIPQQAALWLTIPRLAAGRRFLLAGDNTLVDASLAVNLRLADPAACYVSLIQGRGRLTRLALESALDQVAAASLATIVRDYAAADLSDHVVQETIRRDLATALTLGLVGWGFDPPEVTILQFNMALDLVLVAERSAELQQRLQDLAASREMDRLVEAAEIQAFARQLEADYELPGFAALVQSQTPPAPVPGASVADQPTPDQSRWWVSLLEHFRRSRVAADIALSRVGLPATPPADAPAEPLSLRLLLWLRYALILLSLGFVALAFLTMRPHDPEFGRALLELLLKAGLLALGILATLFGEERHQRRAFQLRSRASVLALVGHNLLQADSLVRRQVQAELEQARRTLREIRFKALRAQVDSESSDLKRLEEKLRRLSRNVNQVGAAPAALMTGAHLTPRMLDQLLTDEEALIQQARQLSDAALGLLTDTIGGATIVPGLSSFEAALAQFEQRFFARQRVLPVAGVATP